MQKSDAIQEGFKEPINPPEVAVKPKNMPNRGHYPTYKR
jgi:hypothetical protein